MSKKRLQLTGLFIGSICGALYGGLTSNRLERQVFFALFYGLLIGGIGWGIGRIYWHFKADETEKEIDKASKPAENESYLVAKDQARMAANPLIGLLLLLIGAMSMMFISNAYIRIKHIPKFLLMPGILLIGRSFLRRRRMRKRIHSVPTAIEAPISIYQSDINESQQKTGPWMDGGYLVINKTAPHFPQVCLATGSTNDLAQKTVVHTQIKSGPQAKSWLMLSMVLLFGHQFLLKAIDLETQNYLIATAVFTVLPVSLILSQLKRTKIQFFYSKSTEMPKNPERLNPFVNGLFGMILVVALYLVTTLTILEKKANFTYIRGIEQMLLLVACCTLGYVVWSVFNRIRLKSPVRIGMAFQDFVWLKWVHVDVLKTCPRWRGIDSLTSVVEHPNVEDSTI